MNPDHEAVSIEPAMWYMLYILNLRLHNNIQMRLNNICLKTYTQQFTTSIFVELEMLR